MNCCDCCGDYIDVDAVRYVIFDESENDVAELCQRCYDYIHRDAYWKRNRAKQLAEAEAEAEVRSELI